MQGDALVLDFPHRRELLGFAFCDGLTNVVAAHHFDLRLLRCGQTLPLIHIDGQFVQRRRLVPTGEVVVLGNLIEAELQIDGGHREFGRVNGAEFQCREDVAGGKKLCRGTELFHYLCTEPEDAHLHALEIFGRFDFLAEPARGFGYGAAAYDTLDVVASVDLVIMLFTAAIVEIGKQFGPFGAEGQCGEDGKRRIFPIVIPGQPPAQIDRSG